MGKLTCMREDGVFLGVKGSTGEMIVGDEKGGLEDKDLEEEDDDGELDEGELEVHWRCSVEIGEG